VILSSGTYCSMICKLLGHCRLEETVMIPSISSICILFCFDFRNSTPLLFCHPSLTKQKLKELETCQDKIDKLDKQDKLGKQDGLQPLHSIKHKLFSPALKSTIEKYRTRPDFSQNTAVFNKGIVFLMILERPVFFWGTARRGFLFIYN
jgi:hypothetical protein